MGIRKFIGMLAGPHYKMERFCATFLAFTIALGGIFGISLKIHQDHKRLTLGTQAKYTSEAQFSLSQDTVEVVNIYRDTNFTKAFVLLKVGSMANLSTDAKDYKVFMTSYEKNNPLTCNPTAAIYMFGNTGYIGLYFADDAGFQPALYDIVVRNTKMLVQGDRNAAAYYFKDESYVNHNQMHLYANFAGSDALIAKFLDKPDPKVRDIYVELISEQSADMVRTELNTTLLDMNSKMALINEYSRRLNNNGISVPELPPSIAGDYITTEAELTAGNPETFSVSMLTQGTVVDSTTYNVTVDSEDEESYQSFVTGDTLYLVTDYVYPGGIQYNYQDVSLQDNILDTLKPETLTFEQWVASKKTETSQYYGRGENDVVFSNWVYKTGATFQESQYDKTSQLIGPDIRIYEQAVRDLAQLKLKYQTQLLFNLLAEDASSRNIASVFSVRSDADTLTLY